MKLLGHSKGMFDEIAEVYFTEMAPFAKKSQSIDDLEGFSLESRSLVYPALAEISENAHPDIAASFQENMKQVKENHQSMGEVQSVVLGLHTAKHAKNNTVMAELAAAAAATSGGHAITHKHLSYLTAVGPSLN